MAGKKTLWSVVASDQQSQKQENVNGPWGGIGYLGEKVGLGALSSIEGIWDYTASGVAKMFGQDAWAEKQVANDWVNYNHADEWFNPSGAWKIAGDVAGGIGTSIPGIAVGVGISLASGGALTGVGASIAVAGASGLVSGLGAAGNALKEAYRETGQLGANEYKYGALVGATEAGVETASSLVGWGSGRAISALAGKGAAQAATKTASKGAVAGFVKSIAGDFAGEAAEEAIAEYLTPYWQRATYDPNAKNATASEIGYAALVGGLSGILMGEGTVLVKSGAGVASNFVKGDKAVKKGRSGEILKRAGELAEYEKSNKTGLGTYERVGALYEELSSSMKETGGNVQTAKQKMKLAELDRAYTYAKLEGYVLNSADRIARSAPSVAERYRTLGYTDASGQKLNFTAEEILSGVDTSDLESKAGLKRYYRSLAKSLKKDGALARLAVTDATGHIMMDSKAFADAALRGEAIADSSDLNRFIETGEKEHADALSRELGIDNWDTLTVDQFRKTVGRYKASGRMDQHRDQVARIGRAKAVASENAVAAPNSVATLQEGVHRFQAPNGDVAIIKENGSFYGFEYSGENISKPLNEAQANKFLQERITATPQAKSTAQAPTAPQQTAAPQVASALQTVAPQTVAATQQTAAPQVASATPRTVSPQTAVPQQTVVPQTVAAPQVASATPRTAAPQTVAAPQQTAAPQGTSTKNLAKNNAAPEGTASVQDNGGPAAATANSVASKATTAPVARQSPTPAGGTLAGARMALKKDSAGQTYVEVENSSIDTTQSPRQIAVTLAEIVRAKFTDFVNVKGQKIGINQRTVGEWVKSVSADTLRKANNQAFSDKANTFENADEILQAAKDYIGEAKKHARKDNFVEFARGVVSFKVGDRGYSADVIVGTTKSGVALLYDLVNIQSKKIVADTSYTAQDRRSDVSATNSSIPQNAENVKTSGEKSAINQHPVAIEAWAKENIPEYAKLSEPNKQAVRMTIRQARAHGLSNAEVTVYARVAARSGLNIVFDAELASGGDARFDGRNTIYIDPDAPVERRHSKLLLHENGHALMRLKGGKKLIREAFDHIDPEKSQEVAAQYIEHYRALGMDAEQYSPIVNEEIAAAYIEDVLGFEGAWDYILSEQPTIKDKWLGLFRKSAQDYAGLSDLSAQSRKFLREYKKLFDELASRNQGNNALSLAQSSQVNKTDSEKDERLSLQKKENSIANYTEKQYNSFGWARANEVLNAGQAKDFEAKFAQALQGSKAFPKTKGGDYMVAVSDIYDPTLEGVNNVIVYAKGTMEMPVIARVIKIDLYNETDLDTKRRNIYAFERRGLQPQAGGIYHLYFATDYGSGFHIHRHGAQSVGYHDQLGSDRGAGGRTARGTAENSKNVKKKAVHYRFDQDGSGHGTVKYSDGTIERFALPENGKKGWTLEELIGDDPTLKAELLLMKGAPKVNGRVSVSSGQMQYQIADNMREKSYTRKSALAVIGKLSGTENLTANTRDQLAAALWQGLNQASSTQQRKQFAHDMAEYTVATLVSEAKVENPAVADAIERLNTLRTGVGKLTFSESDLAEISHVRDKKGAKQILGRWGRKNAGAQVYPLDVFVNDVATSTPGMQHLAEMHPVDAFLEIDKLYGEALAASKDRWISAYWDMPDSEIPAMVDSVEQSILTAFREEGDKSKFTRRVEERVKDLTRRAEYWKAEYDKVRGRDRLQGVLWSQAQHLKDLKLGTFLNATQHKSEIFKGSIEKLSRVNWRGNLTNVTSIRRTIADLRSWYVKDNPVLEYDGDNSPGLYLQGVADVMDALASGDKAFTKNELKSLSQVMSFFTKIVENYNRVWRQGKWVEATPLAEGYIKILQENKALSPGLFLRMMKTSWINKYHEFFGEPASVVARMDLYERGFFTETFEELQRAAVDTQVAEMELLADYDAFLLKNKKYIERASSETVFYRGADIPRMHLISLYMTMKRDHARAGIALNGFAFKNGVKTTRLDGVMHQDHATKAEIDAAIKDQMTEIEGMLTKTDHEYIAILEKGYNVDAKRLKAERDMQRLGFTNAAEGYYYPIRRSNIAKNVDTSVAAELDRVSNASFNKSIVQGAKQELFIESADVVFRRHVHAVCQYAFLSPAIDTYNRLYNLDISGTPNHPTSVATESNEVWERGNQFFKKLIADIQGIPAGSQEGAAFLAWLRGGYAKYQLGANPKVWATQLSSLFAASSVLDGDSITRGLAVASGDVEQYCPLAKLRSYENTAALAQGNLDGKGRRVMRKIDKFSDMLMAPIGKVDRFVIGRLFGACQVQVAKDGGAKIGTEANKKAAGELLERVILQTQQNSIATERSAAMRSGNEVYKTLTMFSADSMKIMGRVIDSLGRLSALKARIKATADPKARAALKGKRQGARRDARKSIAALTLSAAFMAGVAQLFRALYNKEKDEDETTAQIMLADFGGNLLGGLPAIRDFYSFFVDGYEMEDPTYSAVNDLLSSAKSVMELPALILSGEKNEQDAARGVKNLAYAAGQILGLPTRNVYNVLYGLTKRFSPETAYKIDETFYKKNYQNDLAKAIEQGDGEMADYLLSLLCGERIGDDMSEAVHGELFALASKGYRVIPRKVATSIAVNGEEIELTDEEQAAIRGEYADCRDVLDRLIATGAYKALSDEQKALAIDYVYDACHDTALSRALGVDKGNTVLVGEVVGVENLALLHLSTKGITSEKDEDGKTISGSKRKQVVAAINTLNLPTEQRLLLICAKGYSLQNGDIKGISAGRAKQLLLRYIRQLAVSEEQRLALAEMCGFEVKNGRIKTTLALFQ